MSFVLCVIFDSCKFRRMVLAFDWVFESLTKVLLQLNMCSDSAIAQLTQLDVVGTQLDVHFGSARTQLTQLEVVGIGLSLSVTQ